MGDWIGLGFFVLLIVGAIVALRILSKPRVSTSDEFERRAAEEKTMLGATLSALQEITDPADARSKEVVMQMKEGTFQKKKREGKAGGTESEDGE
ncbi:MAG: hypothetical protein WBC19_01245 [Pyrinomonadaceae bacterium]|nr:hypothetical protein [Pyrinomonadaceae bacterium]